MWVGVDILLWLGVGRCGWLGVDRCGWVWMGVVSKDFKGFLFVMHFCQVFVVLAGCGWWWMGVAGCGWVWVGVGGGGWGHCLGQPDHFPFPFNSSSARWQHSQCLQTLITITSISDF